MKRNNYLANRLREVFLNGTWIANTNFKEQLIHLNWEIATRQINQLNSIALLTFHMNYYLSGLIRAFQTGKLEIKDKYSFDMPKITSQSDWDNLVNDFLKNAQQFCDDIENFDDQIFDQPFFEEKYGSYLRNIEGVIEHGYYHLGQVSLIKKLIMVH